MDRTTVILSEPFVVVLASCTIIIQDLIPRLNPSTTAATRATEVLVVIPVREESHIPTPSRTSFDATSLKLRNQTCFSRPDGGNKQAISNMTGGRSLRRYFRKLAAPCCRRIAIVYALLMEVFSGRI